MAFIYKILPRALWDAAQVTGEFRGAPVDLADGYIHFSTADQAVETAAKHFAGQEDLLLVAFDAETMGNDLRWEPSRGGALFPHLYNVVCVDQAQWVRDLPLGDNGVHLFPGLGQ